MFRRADELSVDAEREALRRQRAEGAAEIERLKRVLTERVEFVRLRERELEQALAQAGANGGTADRRALFRLPETRREDPAAEQQRQVLEARTADLARRETALRDAEAALETRRAQVEAVAAKPAKPLTKSERERALDEREAQLAEREAAVEGASERLARVETRLAELEEAELAFVRTQAELAARSDRLAEREQELATREREHARANGSAASPDDGPSLVDVEAIEARLRRLESGTAGRGQSFSAGVRSLQQRGNRPRREPEAPLH